MNRSVHIDMPALPPFPEFPTPEQNIREFQERLQEIDLILRTGTPTKGEMQQQVTQSISRYITSENGWTATLFGLWPNHLSIDIKPAFAFQSIFKEIADWWLSTVEEAVVRCPEPGNATRQYKTKSGRNRIARTTGQTFRSTTDLVLPSGEWHAVNISATLHFDGKAPASDVIWPFPLFQVSTAVLDAIGNALGNADGRTGTRGKEAKPIWQPFYTEPRRPPKRPRVFEDFSGKTAQERQVHVKPQPATLKPSSTWPIQTHRLSRRICGGTECQYEPKSEGMSRSGCDAAWREHSKAVFEVFRNANPDLQYKDHHSCVLDAQRKRHNCYTKNHGQLRGHSLDHDELCRFPDGEKLIISHPYPNGANDDFSEDLESWQREVPGIAIRTGGEQKSWYFPGHSSLVLIGTSDVLDKVNLDYEVPTDTEPAGCARWPSK